MRRAGVQLTDLCLLYRRYGVGKYKVSSFHSIKIVKLKLHDFSPFEISEIDEG